MDIDFPRVNKLPPYIFDEIQKLKMEAKVAVSPGIGFGDYGEGYVRFSLIENEHRIKQAVRSIKKFISSQEKIHVLS
jgi:alanine-synthesizing transaminase